MLPGCGSVEWHPAPKTVATIASNTIKVRIGR